MSPLEDLDATVKEVIKHGYNLEFRIIENPKKGAISFESHRSIIYKVDSGKDTYGRGIKLEGDYSVSSCLPGLCHSIRKTLEFIQEKELVS